MQKVVSLPSVILVLDEFSARTNRGAGFSIRDSRESKVNIIAIENLYTIYDARQRALALGYDVTHWLRSSNRTLYELKK